MFIHTAPGQSSMDYENTKTPSTHRRLGSATLSQLTFPGGSNPNFPWEKSQWGNIVVKKIKKIKKSKYSGYASSLRSVPDTVAE